MDFYENLSKFYEDLFPPNGAQIRFFTELCQRGDKVLDIGAGTGGYAAVLAGNGSEVTALEIGAMYPKLLNTAEMQGFRALEMGMEQIGELDAGIYTVLMCIGNTLVHLGDTKAVTDFLRAGKRLLQPGGTLVVQIVNYDRVLKNNLTSLPVIRVDHKGLTLERNYSIASDTVRFMTKLTVEGHCYDSETRLLALKRDALIQCFASAGFENVVSYGDFEKAQWNEESPATVVVAQA